MVGEKYDDRILRQAVVAQSLHQPSHLIVDPGCHAVVACDQVAQSEPFRQLLGVLEMLLIVEESHK